MKVVEISESTRFPLSLVVSALGFVAMVTLWIGLQMGRLDNAEARLNDIEHVQADTTKDRTDRREAVLAALSEIKIRLARIEEKLEK